MCEHIMQLPGDTETFRVGRPFDALVGLLLRALRDRSPVRSAVACVDTRQPAGQDDGRRADGFLPDGRAEVDEAGDDKYEYHASADKERARFVDIRIGHCAVEAERDDDRCWAAYSGDDDADGESGRRDQSEPWGDVSEREKRAAQHDRADEENVFCAAGGDETTRVRRADDPRHRGRRGEGEIDEDSVATRETLKEGHTLSVHDIRR
jgi:hypothetical protein